MNKKAVIYLNLGTPDDTTVSSVRRYLKQFLMDAYVLDIPAIFRWILVHVIIVPFRAPKSAHAYQQIWGSDSPLRSISQSLVAKLNTLFRGEADVILGMRYGQPSVEAAVAKILSGNYNYVSVFPAYPQYALSSTETGFALIREQLKAANFKGDIRFINDYYEHPLFLDAVVEKVQATIAEMNPDFILFSYHGLPKRHVMKINPTCAGGGSCCEVSNAGNRMCYRRQCLATTRGLVERLNLPAEKYSVAFQSRLGGGWIEPFTDVVIEDLAKQGIRKLAVVCPSFTVDCLETLEEIAIRGRESFLAAGGRELRLVSCVNDSQLWAQNMKKLIEDPLL